MANSKISALTSATTPLAGTETLPIVQSSTTKKVAVSDLTAGRSISATSLGLGVASPATVLDVQAASAAVRVTSTTGTNQVFTRYGNTGGFLYTGIDTSAGGFLTGVAYSPFIWSSVNSAMLLATNNNECLRLETNADVKVSTGNLVIGTAAKGVNFTANTPQAGMTSQLLNWYEEGTWTPNQGAGLTVVGAFSSTGLYTRIGRQVTVTGRVTGATSINTSGSGIVCTNLPFTVGTNSNSVGVMTNTATNNTNVYVNPGTATMYSSMASGVSGSLYFTVTYSV
jgi:hypothetical protein